MNSNSAISLLFFRSNFVKDRLILNPPAKIPAQIIILLNNSTSMSFFFDMVLTFLVRTSLLALFFWSTVSTLFKPCGPFAVVWSVWTVVVNSLKSHFLGRVSHVSKKVFKLFPAVTDHYAAPAVILIGAILWVGTSLDHGRPYPVQILVRKLPGTIGLPASTRASIVSPQRLSTNQPLPTAVASAPVPYLVMDRIRTTTQNCKEGELLSSQVDESHVSSMRVW